MQPEKADWAVRLPAQMCGVYALCDGGEVLYVGQSLSLHSRIMTHRNNYIRWVQGKRLITTDPVVRFDEVWIRYCEEEQLDRLEWDMVQKYKPKVNKALKPVDRVEADVRYGRVRIDLDRLGLSKWTMGSRKSSRDFVRRV